MNNHKITGGAAVAISACVVLLIGTPAPGAASPTRWDVCAAADTEPICDLLAGSTSNGAGTNPGVAERPTRRVTGPGASVVDCTPTSPVVVHACPE